ncbi:MAG: hypothetical protein Q7K47_02365 [Fusobacterium sp. JB019]|nr:hypothetical protein [Fusobacterium sp. JB019]
MGLVNVIKSFLGWSCVINILFLLLSTLMVTVFQKPISKIHSKLFDLDEKALHLEYFKFLAFYKMIVIIFNIVPYLVLLIMS